MPVGEHPQDVVRLLERTQDAAQDEVPQDDVMIDEHEDPGHGSLRLPRRRVQVIHRRHRALPIS